MQAERGCVEDQPQHSPSTSSRGFILTGHSISHLLRLGFAPAAFRKRKPVSDNSSRILHWCQRESLICFKRHT